MSSTSKQGVTTNASTMVSIVLPAYNEAAGLGTVIESIRTVVQDTMMHYEIIIVDDGSSDKTYEEIKRFNTLDPNVKGIRLSRRFGKESALLVGLRAAVCGAVISMYADLQHPPELIPQMLEEWRNGAQVVHGVKQDSKAAGAFTRLSAALFNKMISLTSELDMRGASDFKLLDRSVVRLIVDELPERGRFFRGLAGWVGFKQATVLFDVRKRDAGDGKWSGYALVDLALTAFTSFTSAPLRLVSILGVVTLILGILISAEALWSWFRGYAVSGFVTIIITLLLIGSFIMISLGIIGEYIAKIFDEVKNRPSYLIESVCGFANIDSLQSNEDRLPAQRDEISSLLSTKLQSADHHVLPSDGSR